MPNMYGDSGFTTVPAVLEILEPLAEEGLGGARRFRGLDAASASRLVELLPSLGPIANPGAPSLEVAVELIHAYGGTMGGYWIVPPRSDEGVFVDELTVPRKALRAVRKVATRPDEQERLFNGFVRLWWD